MLLSKLVIEYGEYQHKLKKLAEATTLKNYLGILREFVRWIDSSLEDLRESVVSDLSQGAFARFIDHISVSYPKRAQNIRAAVRSFCVYLVRLKWIESDITKDVEMPEVVAGRREGPPEEDIDKILATVETMEMSDRYRHAVRAVIYLLVFAGLRKKEINDLQVEDIDLKERQIFVRLGKGNQSRYVKPPAEFWPVMTAYLAQRPAYPGTHLLVYSENYALGITSSATILQKVMAAAGLAGQPITPHCMRHAFATRAARNNAPLTVIQAQLGHSKATTTAIYIHAPKHITETEARYFGKADPAVVAPIAPPAPHVPPMKPKEPAKVVTPTDPDARPRQPSQEQRFRRYVVNRGA